MRVIDLGKERSGRTTVLSYGAMRSGKTRFAATFPRPLFLSDSTESGWTTITNMDPNALYEPDRLPKVWAVDSPTEMLKLVADVEALIKKDPGAVRTVVVDSLTFYADMYLNHLEALQGNRGDGRHLYKKLQQHLQELRIRVHSLPVNVVWLCLEKPPGEENPLGGPSLPGQNGQKFAAGCDYIMYHRSFRPKTTEPVQWEVRTKLWGAFQAGGRDEGKLPDPLSALMVQDDGVEVYAPDCTYLALEEALGLKRDSLIDPVKMAG